MVKGTLDNTPDDKTYTEKEWRGLLNDKQKAVEKSQELQARIVSLETTYEQRIKELEKQLNDKPVDYNVDLGDPDAYATNKIIAKEMSSLKKELANALKEMSSLKDEYIADRTQEVSKKQRESIEKARAKYAEGKVGQGLTFDEVIEGTKRMIAKNPTFQQAIAVDENPGELMYTIGLRDDVIAKRAEAHAVSAISPGKVSKSGLSGSTIPSGYMTQKYIQDMQAKDPNFVKNNLDKIHESQKHWSANE